MPSHEKVSKQPAQIAPSSPPLETPDLALLQEANDTSFLARVAGKCAVDALNQGDAAPAAALFQIAAQYAQRFSELSTELKIEVSADIGKLPPELQVAEALAKVSVTPIVGNVTDAIRLAERALVMFEANGGLEFLKPAVRILNIVGAVLWRGKRFEDGLRHLQRAEQMCDAMTDDNDASEGMMSVLFNIIQTAKSLNRDEEVVRALARLKTFALSGADTIQSVESRVTAAQLLQSEEHFEDALVTFEKALSIMDAVLEAQSAPIQGPVLLATLNGITELLNHLGRAPEAAPYVSRLISFAANYGAMAPVLLELNYVSFDQENGTMHILKNADGTGGENITKPAVTDTAVAPVSKDFDLRQFRVAANTTKN